MDDPARPYTQRSKQHEPDHSYPQEVQLRLVWTVNGHARIRTSSISADEFFGVGGSGAPIEGIAILNRIEQMRRAGPPIVEQKGKKHAVRKTKR